jgi:hypothetical protein
MANVTLDVPPTSSIDPSTLDDLAIVLSGRPVASRTDVAMATVSALSLKQLQEAARRLGLSGYSRLKKDALAQAVWESWQAVAANGSSPNGHGLTEARSNGTSDGTSVGTSDGSKSNGAGVMHLASETRRALAVGEHPVSAEAHGADSGTAVAPVAHKYELEQSATASTREMPRDIPWGYGLDRVTAMPVDPDRLFVYWEVLEDSIARARAALGSRGEGAWLNLRIYDITGRIFDGGNAHGFFDQGLDRNARQWFFMIGKPTSEVVVELGMCAPDGGFQKIARSGRVEFPRRDPVPWAEPEWLTVRAAGSEVVRTWLPHPGTGGSGGPGATGGPAATGAAGAAEAAEDGGPSLVWNMGVEAPGEERVVERTEWEEIRTDGVTEAHRRVTWEEQSTITSWQEGPFSYPVEVPAPVLESFVGRTRVFRSGARTRVVYGPWQVVIRGIGATKAASVISRWEVYRSWGEQKGTEMVGFAERAIFAGERGPGGASERVLTGASERSWRGASELRLGGSSELFYLGASERRLMGASELQYAGASERVRRGASERRLVGASEWRYAGASERRLGGGSEERLGGGSEHRFLGASENFAGNRPAASAPAPASEQGWPDAAQVGGGGRGTSGGRASGD